MASTLRVWFGKAIRGEHAPPTARPAKLGEMVVLVGCAMLALVCLALLA